MIYRYRVDCWVPPRSGFDLAEFHNATERIKKALKVLFGKETATERAVDVFNSGHEGMVLESLVVESDKPFKENEKEIKQSIQKRFPEAEIISHQIIDAVPAN